MSIFDDEDRIWKARVAESKDGWPFDADRNDPLTARRIAVTCSHPRWYYLVSFDQESEARPTEHEVDLLASYLDEYKTRWYNPGYRAHMERRPLDVDGGANGVVFHKWGPDDWGYRRQSYEYGYLFTVVFPRQRADHPDHKWRGPFSLLEIMDRLHTILDEPLESWVEWKAAHPEVFAEVQS